MDTAPDTRPGKHGGTLTPFKSGAAWKGNANGRPDHSLIRAVTYIRSKTRNARDIADFLISVAAGEEPLHIEDRVKVAIYLYNLHAQADEAELPVIDWDKLNDDERSRLASALTLAREIAERQARESADGSKPPSP